MLKKPINDNYKKKIVTFSFMVKIVVCLLQVNQASGRVYLLKFKTDDRKFFFWMQVSISVLLFVLLESLFIF